MPRETLTMMTPGLHAANSSEPTKPRVSSDCAQRHFMSQHGLVTGTRRPNALVARLPCRPTPPETPLQTPAEHICAFLRPTHHVCCKPTAPATSPSLAMHTTLACAHPPTDGSHSFPQRAAMLQTPHLHAREHDDVGSGGQPGQVPPRASLVQQRLALCVRGGPPRAAPHRRDPTPERLEPAAVGGMSDSCPHQDRAHRSTGLPAFEAFAHAFAGSRDLRQTPARAPPHHRRPPPKGWTLT